VTTTGLAEIADRTLLADGGWSVVVVGSPLLDSTARSLAEEFNLVLESAVSRAFQVPAIVPTGPTLIERLSALRSTDVAVLILRDEEVEAASRLLDYGRGRLVDRCRGIIVTSDAGLRTLAASAPSFWSWTGAQVWRPDFSAGVLDVETRLASLRNELGKTDEEIIEHAKDGTLPSDPVYAEWLTLLGRGDLIGR
jgi:hypothetical protein